MITETRCRLTTEPGDFWNVPSTGSRYMTLKNNIRGGRECPLAYVCVDEEGRIMHPSVYTMSGGPQTVEVEVPDRRTGEDRRAPDSPIRVGRRRIPQPQWYNSYDRRSSPGRRVGGDRRES